MAVPLMDIFRQNEQTEEPKVTESTVTLVQEPKVALKPKVAESTVTLVQEPKVDLNVPLGDNPFGLLDDEIDELLKGLEAIDYKGDNIMDSELSAVLNMDVSDFVV
jgi:hypothetical protein